MRLLVLLSTILIAALLGCHLIQIVSSATTKKAVKPPTTENTTTATATTTTTTTSTTTTTKTPNPIRCDMFENVNPCATKESMCEIDANGKQCSDTCVPGCDCFIGFERNLMNRCSKRLYFNVVYD